MDGPPRLAYALPQRGGPAAFARAAQMPFYLRECALADFGRVVSALAGIREVSLFSRGLPSESLCWLARAARLRPAPEVVCYLVEQPHFKYLTAYFSIFLRLTMRGVGVYAALEPLYRDPRRLLVRGMGRGGGADGGEEEERARILHVDELAELLLTSERAFGILLPSLRPRRELEARGFLRPLREALSAPPRDDYLGEPAQGALPTIPGEAGAGEALGSRERKLSE